MDYSKKVPIIELYKCIQGEGRDTGIPMILIRFTGCRLRCQFSDTSFCDTPYASWSLEKSKFSLSDVEQFYLDHPQIKHTLITGGGPTLQGELLKEVCKLAKRFNHYVCIESEGSEFVETEADFISLSPKLESSSPRVGTTQPWNGKEVTIKDLEQHEKWRKNYFFMKQLITFHPDYQFKPVICSEKDLEEVEKIIKWLDIPANKVWAMPEGQSDEELKKNRIWLVEKCIDKGWSYTDRIHIVVFGKDRGR